MNLLRLSLSLRLLAAIFLGASLVVGAWLFFRSGSDPVYRGKKASEWRVQLERSDRSGREEASDALRRIGTNQASHLTRLIRAQDSNVKGDLIYFLNQQSWTRFETAGDKRARGYFEIEALGPGAVALVPNLTAILLRGERPGEAADALAKMGALGVPALKQALRSEHGRVRAAAAGAFGEFGPVGERYVPLLLTALQDRYPMTRASAALALGEIHQRGPEVVPALMARLTDPELVVRRYSTRALGEFHEQAMDAVPSLLKAAKSLDTVVRDNAIFALRKIDPKSAALVER